MQYLKCIVLGLSLLISLNSCGKGGGAKPAPLAPENLQLSAHVNTDGSGVVHFTASAINATGYDYDFGNGVKQSAPNGTTEYKYTSPGTHTYTVSVTAKSKDNLTAVKTTSVTVTVAGAPFWADEFNTNGAPDPQKWVFDIGTGSDGWGNQEKQYYTNRTQNVEVSNGTLKIKAIKESYNGSAYTSARLLSKGKFEFKYGKVEVSAKLPVGGGTWPAIWMLGANVGTAGWPACGEIDIMEFKGNQPTTIYGTLHYPGRSGGNADGKTTILPNAQAGFHKYTVDWGATTIRFYVDDQLFFTFNNSTAVPFNHDFFILLNFAMGGTFGGAIDPAFTSAVFEVDYVRVYKN